MLFLVRIVASLTLTGLLLCAGCLAQTAQEDVASEEAAESSLDGTSSALTVPEAGNSRGATHRPPGTRSTISKRPLIGRALGHPALRHLCLLKTSCGAPFIAMMEATHPRQRDHDAASSRQHTQARPAAVRGPVASCGARTPCPTRGSADPWGAVGGISNSG